MKPETPCQGSPWAGTPAAGGLALCLILISLIVPVRETQGEGFEGPEHTYCGPHPPFLCSQAERDWLRDCIDDLLPIQGQYCGRDLGWRWAGNRTDGTRIARNTGYFEGPREIYLYPDSAPLYLEGGHWYAHQNLWGVTLWMEKRWEWKA